MPQDPQLDYIPWHRFIVRALTRFALPLTRKASLPPSVHVLVYELCGSIGEFPRLWF